jgi:hypothetical protein
MGTHSYHVSTVGPEMTNLRSTQTNFVGRVCVLKGQLPRALMNHGQDPTYRQVLTDKIAPWMALKIRCQEVIAKCSEAVTENGLRSMSLDQERALDILLRTYESQVDDLELRAVTGMLLSLNALARHISDRIVL